MRKHNYPAWEDKHNRGYLGIQDLTADEIASRVHCEMKAGDVVFFHPQAIHGSGVNMRTVADATNGDPNAFRKAVSVHYRRRDLAWVDHATLPKFKTHIDSYDGAAPQTEAERLERARFTTLGFRESTRDI